MVILRCLCGSETVLLGVFIGKCEMSSTHISQENEHAYSWLNVNLCRTPSDKKE